MSQGGAYVVYARAQASILAGWRRRKACKTESVYKENAQESVPRIERVFIRVTPIAEEAMVIWTETTEVPISISRPSVNVETPVTVDAHDSSAWAARVDAHRTGLVTSLMCLEGVASGLRWREDGEECVW